MKTTILIIICLAIISFTPVFYSCEKYLAERPDQELSVPNSLEDLQMLLDFYRGMNVQLPVAPILLADNFYLTTDAWESAQELRSEERRVGKEWVSTCRSRGSPDHEKKKKKT